MQTSRWTRIARAYLVASGVAIHVALVAAGAAYLLYADGRGLGSIVERAQARFGNDHPAVTAAATRLLDVVGLPTVAATRTVTLPPFPGPGQWPAHGVLPGGLAPQTYDELGVPRQAGPPGAGTEAEGARTVARVDDARSLREALRTAVAGDVVTLAPGTYRLGGRRIALGHGGTPDAPITLRAETPGTARLELATLEGFYVDRPYWVFENLAIRGVCREDSYCEHAFHVVGPADGTVIRNNEIVDFNAPLKVNLVRRRGVESHADHGLVQNNSVYNTRPRQTANPVTLLNINAGSGWVVSANFIADGSKARGDRISYAAFMKSNSTGGVFERNLVVCHWRLPVQGDTRVGLSFGGGGSARSACRGGACAAEHTAGTLRYNVIARCPRDVGIYLNRAARTRIHNNLLTGTVGIDVRFPESTADIHDNIVEGRIARRDGGDFTGGNNLIAPRCGALTRWFRTCSATAWLADPVAGDLRPIDADALLRKGASQRTEARDFCGHPVQSPADIGPIHYPVAGPCLPSDAGRSAIRPAS